MNSTPAQHFPLRSIISLPKATRTWSFLVIAGIFFLPALFLFLLAGDVMKDEEKHEIARAERILLARIRELQTQIDPIQRLNHSLEQALVRLGLISPRSERPLLFIPGTPSPCMPKKVLPRFRDEMFRKINAVPLAIWVVGPDGSEVSGECDPRFFSPQIGRSKTAWRNLAAAWFGLLDRKPWASGKHLLVLKSRWKGPSGSEAFQAQVRRFGNQLFGEYLPIEGDLKDPRPFFSGLFGTGRVWLLGRAFTAGSSRSSPFAGGVLALYRDIDLSKRFLLEPTQNNDFCTIEDLDDTTPRFIRGVDRLSLVVPLPPELQGKSGPKKGSLAIIISEKSARPFRSRLIFAGIVLTAGMCGCALFLWGVFRGKLNLPISIRGQLAIAMALAVLPPVLACGLVAQGFLAFWQTEGRRGCQEQLQQRVGLLESGLNGFGVALSERIWKAKERVSPQLVDPRTAIEPLLQNISNIGKAQLIQMVCIDGRECVIERPLPGIQKIPPGLRDKMAKLGRIISMRLIKLYNPLSWKELSGAGLAKFLVKIPGDLIESIWKTDEFAGFLGRDPILLDVALTGFREGRALGYPVFLPGENYGRRLGGMIYITQQLEAIGKTYFDRLYAESGIFLQTDSKYRVTTGVFHYSHVPSSEQIRLNPENCWPRNADHDPQLVSLAKQAALHPGADPKPFDDGTEIAYQVFREFPYIAVAVAEPITGSGSSYGAGVVFYFFLAYLSALIWLASRFLQRIFLEPIGELIQAGGAVASGDYSPILELPQMGEFASLGREFGAMCKGLREGRLLTRFVSRDAVREVREHVSTDFEPGGERRTVAVLFSHLAGFTEWSGGLQPNQLLSELNGYFSAMEPQVLSQEGNIDKFIGDAIMAVFHVVPGKLHPVARALAASRGMRRALRNLNIRRQALGRPILRSGIGIAAGEVLSGRIGSRLRRLDFTVIGDAVNLAARLEGLREKATDDEIVMDSMTAALMENKKESGPMQKPTESVSEAFFLPPRPLGAIELKGKTRPVEVLAFPSEPAK